MVEHPPHYQTESGLEAIDVIEAFFADNAHLANAFRYMSRLDKKWDGDEDLDKAIWYLQRLREFRNGGTQESEPDVPDKTVYEFFGRVSNVQFETTMDTAEVDLTLTPTMISAATHRIRFEISRDNGENVADLFFGKPAQPLIPESWTKAVTSAYDTGGFLKVGDTKMAANSDPQYAPGDKVVITEASPDYPHTDWFGFSRGDVCEFVRDGDWDGEPGYSILVRNGDEQSVPNTHFARSGPVALFRVGDRVRVIENPGMTGAVQVGAIGKIQAGPDSDGDYEVKFEDDWHFLEPGEIEAADGPKVGDSLTITSIAGGHGYAIGDEVMVERPGGWRGTDGPEFVLCARVSDNLQQSLPLSSTSW